MNLPGKITEDLLFGRCILILPLIKDGLWLAWVFGYGLRVI
jgi:hypothetical protein